MKKRSFLLPLATALTALVGGVAPVSAHVAAPALTTVDAGKSQALDQASKLPPDLTIERAGKTGQKFAQHRSHSSHSSHRSHYSSRK